MGEIYSDLDSDFPYKITTMNRVQDVTLSAKPYVDLYNQYYSQGDFDSANQVINDHPELLTMMLNMKIVNQMIDEIKATQRTFKDDVESYIFTIVKLKGDYSGAVKYIKYNIVYYNLQPYMAIADDIPIGTLPTNINYWYPLAIKGEQGASGLGLSPRGYWNESTQYYTDDMVAYNNILWGALSDNINYIPNESSTVWLKLLAFSSEYLTYDNSISGLIATTMQGAVDELADKYDQCFTSVSNGKTLVANAITDKGVTTSSNDTFATMANNISSITTGVDTSDTTALVSDVLEGKAFYDSSMHKVNGTIPNLNSIIHGDDCTSPSYPNVPIYVVPDNADAQFSVLGANLNKKGLIVAPRTGYYNNTSGAATAYMYVAQNIIANRIGLTSDKLLSGKSVCGVNGTGTTPHFNFPLTISTTQPTPIISGHIWVNSSKGASISSIQVLERIDPNISDNCLIFNIGTITTKKYYINENKTLTDGSNKRIGVYKMDSSLDWLAHYNSEIDFEYYNRPMVYSKVNGVLDVETAYMWNGSSWVLLSQNGSYAIFPFYNGRSRQIDVYNRTNHSLVYNTSLYNDNMQSFSISSCSSDGTYIRLYDKIYKRSGNTFSLYYTAVGSGSYTYLKGVEISKNGQYLIVAGLSGDNAQIKLYKNNNSTFVEETTVVDNLNAPNLTNVFINKDATALYFEYYGTSAQYHYYNYYIKSGTSWVQAASYPYSTYYEFNFFSFTPDNKYVVGRYKNMSNSTFYIIRYELNYQTGQLINPTNIYTFQYDSSSYCGMHPSGLLFLTQGNTLKCIRVSDGTLFSINNNLINRTFNFDLSGNMLITSASEIYSCSISGASVTLTLLNNTGITTERNPLLIPN